MELVKNIIKKGYIFEKSAIELINNKNIDETDFLLYLSAQNTKFINEKIVSDYLKTKNRKEKKVIINKSTYSIAKDIDSNVEIHHPEINSRERDINDFYYTLKDRFEKTRSILRTRKELRNTLSINNIKKLNVVNEQISIIGIIKDIYETKNGNYILEIEDNTGDIKAFVSKDESSVDVENIIVDDIIGLVGKYNGNFFYISSVVYPDIPFPDKINKINDDLNAVFISDLHYGSKNFIKKLENKFIKWINSNDKEALKTKHIFIAGDIADGVGVYPTQKEDLEITDIYKQYESFENFVSNIPEHINIIVIPGNHDAVRSAEPQPKFDKKILKTIHYYKNVFLGPNPSYVTIHNQDNQKGIDILMYHGYSFTSIANTIPSLRQKGIGHPQEIMKEVLKRRHLSPFYGATLQSPEKEDYLVINKIPDIFHTADLHSHAIDNYKGVTLISSSTWQAQTSFQDRVGHIANPGKISLVNLKTRKSWYYDWMI